MQDVERELPGLIKQLLQAPADRQRRLIEAHYTTDCRLTHALLVAESREEIVRVFQWWRFANRRLDVDIHEIVLSPDRSTAYVLLDQHVHPLLWWPFVWEMVVVLRLRRGPQGAALIALHDDTVKPSTLLRPLPLLGWEYEHVARRALGWGISTSAWAAGQLWRQAYAAYKATVVLVGGDAGPPPVLDKSGSKVWVQFTQKVTGYMHYAVPPLFGFNLPMSVLMYLREGPGGKMLISKQIDYHSFEGILYTTPLLGAFFQHVFRRFTTLYIVGSAELGAALWPDLEGALRSLPVVGPRLEGLKALAAKLWWRSAPPPINGRKVAPYDPAL